MLSFILPLLPALALAAPAAIERRQAEPSPTLFTFTFAGELVTATWYGTESAVANPPCPTQTFTYDGAAITIPYTGPGTPQSCLTPAANPPCPTQTFTYEGSAITLPYTGPGTPQSCLTPAANPPTPTTTPETPATTPSPPSPTTSASIATVPEGPGNQGPSVATSELVAPTTTASVSQTPATSSSTSLPLGFNYGSSGMTQSSFETQFNIASGLVGTNGEFTAARLYTTIQDGTTNGVISAIPAAIATNTKLLLGLYYPNVDNEIAALTAAITQYGSAFADLVLAISVGSEDLYRDSPTGIENGSDPGATPDEIVAFIQSVRQAIAGTILADKMVGHVDTWTAWVNSSNEAVIAAVDFLGTDAYPYYQNTESNGIAQGVSLFESAYDATVAVAQGKPVWITETGWPVSGPTEADAVPSIPNAEIYWQGVGCGFAFNKIPTFWYDLVDEGASPSFGVTDGTTTPLYNLACS